MRNDNSILDGVAVGGPVAGQFISARGRRYMVTEAEPLPCTSLASGFATPLSTTFKRSVYECVELYGVLFWVHAPLLNERAPSTVLQELLQHYRPTATGETR